MKNRLKKKERITHISFNEAEPLIEVFTHNTDLRKRLTNYSKSYPDSCKRIEVDEYGGALFVIKKGRFCFRLTAPYTLERRKKASQHAIRNNNIKRLKNYREEEEES